MTHALPPPVHVERKGDEGTARLLAGTGDLERLIFAARRPFSLDSQLALEMIADGRVKRSDEDRDRARKAVGR